MANTDARGTPPPPPNLRVSGDEAKECDTCAHYARGKCEAFSNLPVDAEWVCDDFKKGSQPDEDDESETPAEDQPKTLREARVRVREHLRRVRAA